MHFGNHEVHGYGTVDALTYVAIGHYCRQHCAAKFITAHVLCELILAVCEIYGRKSANVKAYSPQSLNLISKNSQVKLRRIMGECMLAFIYLFLNMGISVDEIK